MANPIIKTNINPEDRMVAPGSRYSNSTVIYYGLHKKMTFETYKRKAEYTPSKNDKYTIVPAGMEYRPDRISFETYGTVDFWWRIMEANGIKDIWDFKAGLNLWLPGNIFIW